MADHQQKSPDYRKKTPAHKAGVFPMQTEATPQLRLSSGGWRLCGVAQELMLAVARVKRQRIGKPPARVPNIPVNRQQTHQHGPRQYR
jgi:hypothetical protein